MNLLSTQVVLACTNLSRSQLYRLRERNRFPQPVKTGPRDIGYRRDDIERWIRANVNPRFHFDESKTINN